jgi:hypothetical protein
MIRKFRYWLATLLERLAWRAKPKKDVFSIEIPLMKVPPPGEHWPKDEE